MPKPATAPQMLPRRRRWKIAEARSVLAALSASGLSLPEFANQPGLEPQRLRRWQRRLARDVRRPRTAEQYQKTLEECRAITKQLAHLVERVMTLAYIDADKSQVTRTDADAAELAEGCAAVIRPLSESQNVTFRTEIESPTTVATDPDKLREVMINLLHNAVEYNRPGGEIELRVRPAKGGGAIVEVADTGIGMTPDVQAKIFERFFRADPSRTHTGIHAGLGLAIVKEYVNRLGGTIAVESQLGKGSTFRVTLPG